MGYFTDCKGAKWDVSIDIPTIKRVRSLTGIDLLNVAISDQQSGVFQALSDCVLFADVLYSICKPEADKRGISDEDFGRLLEVDPNEVANTVLEEIACFFQRRGQTKAAEIIRWQIRKSNEMATRLQAELTPETLESLDKVIDDEIEQQISKLQKTFGSTSESLQESQASIPTQPG